MATFDRSTLLVLAKNHSWPSVSIYLPTHRAGADKEQDRIRLKNLLRTAGEQLVAGGLRTPDAEQAVAPMRELLEDATFWRDTGEGLALFVSPDVVERLPLDATVEERVVVGDRFYVRSLIAALRENHRFFALAIDRNGSRLFRGDGATIVEVPLEGAPASLADELRFDEVQPSVQFSSVPTPGSSSGAVFHGHGGEKDTDKINLERYLRKVDTAMSKATVSERGIPLVLLGVEYEIAMFRSITGYPAIAGPQVNGATDELKPHEVHQRALAALEPVFAATQASWLTEITEHEGSALTTRDPKQIADAAAEGRVKSLFFDDAVDALDESGWDLIDLAAAETVVFGGDVHAIAGEETPLQGAAALLRY